VHLLFISSGNKGIISPIVSNQAQSLIAHNSAIKISYFLIKGKGFFGYLKNIPRLRYKIKKIKPDVIHAHYSLSAYVASIAGANPLVVSLMGSDVYAKFPFNVFIWILYKLHWKKTIVKTQRMKNLLKLTDALVIPNGVDITKFQPIDRIWAKEQLGWNQNNKYVIFVADPARKEKNFQLAYDAVKLLNNTNIQLETVYNVSTDLIPIFLNAGNVLILTSFWEGSVNVIKEAMACNVPIVSTDVGDVKENINNIEGCFITTFDSIDVAKKIELALAFSEKKIKTCARERLIERGLDSNTVAEQIIDIYKTL
jgi:teichuronic acid biosynthesis glycosyltransferase TuaC